MGTASIPYIDPNVEHVGVSKLRSLNSSELRNLTKTLVFQENDKSLAVLLGYEQFLTMQNKLKSLRETIDLLMHEEEVAALGTALQDQKEGRTKTIEQIRANLRKRKKGDGV